MADCYKTPDIQQIIPINSCEVLPSCTCNTTEK